MATRLVALAVMAIALSSPAQAADQANYELFRKVERSVLQYPFMSIFDSVHARVNNGVVELSGRVTMPFKRDAIAGRVAKVDGVRAVRNLVAVLPVSPLDDRLRVDIARAIYGNPNFRGYGSRVNPPIRILVERGRVTLEGVVNNDADRRIAGAIVSLFPAFSIANDLKTVAEARDQLERL